MKKLELASQHEAQFAVRQAQQHMEDVELLRVLVESGVDDTRTMKVIFDAEVN